MTAAILAAVALAFTGTPSEPTVDLAPRLRTQLQLAREDARRERRLRGHLARRHTRLRRETRRLHKPTVDHAIALAAAAYGVDRAAMRRVAWCESTHRPWATNGKYVGLFQTGPSFWTHTPFTAFKRTDPYANALATAQVVATQGWRQWECKP